LAVDQPEASPPEMSKMPYCAIVGVQVEEDIQYCLEE
jgi:hypothetical protein